MSQSQLLWRRISIGVRFDTTDVRTSSTYYCISQCNVPVSSGRAKSSTKSTLHATATTSNDGARRRADGVNIRRSVQDGLRCRWLLSFYRTRMVASHDRNNVLGDVSHVRTSTSKHTVLYRRYTKGWLLDNNIFDFHLTVKRLGARHSAGHLTTVSDSEIQYYCTVLRGFFNDPKTRFGVTRERWHGLLFTILKVYLLEQPQPAWSRPSDSSFHESSLFSCLRCVDFFGTHWLLISCRHSNSATPFSRHQALSGAEYKMSCCSPDT